jgi:CRISPR-associated protein Cas1
MLTSNCSFLGDLQEPFRWIADVAVMDAFESGLLDLPDFYFTDDDYRYHFEPEAKQRFLDLLRERFNAGVKYNGRTLKRDTVIEQKTVELGRYLMDRSDRLNFSEPSTKLMRMDDRELRRQILSLSQSDAREFGIGKSTLHYLRKNARRNDSLLICEKTRKRLYNESAPYRPGVHS